jgi:hypothetical protein
MVGDRGNNARVDRWSGTLVDIASAGGNNMRFPRWRKATWAIVAWVALIVVWVIGGTNSATKDCPPESLEACKVGAGIGVAIILFIGFLGFVGLALVWLMSRPRTRLCPRCGSDVKKGLMTCTKCGFDFNALGGTAAATPGAPLVPSPSVAPAPGAAPAPCWATDPTGRFEMRYWNGSHWTAHVTSGGQTHVDPLPSQS